mgnify:CR=1 FL=1|tara:strand:- start:207 stop:524 length:318 start_codon:yes stop_codon:yes gene_type:complete
MSCKSIVDFSCETIIGESFFGFKYEFEPLEITNLEVEFFDKYGNKIPALYYTIANGKLEKLGADVWQMVPFVPTVNPGLYTYHVRVIFANETEKQTIITGTKKFI